MLFDPRRQYEPEPEVAVVLRTARAAIEDEQNWWSGQVWPEAAGKMCAIVAIFNANPGSDARVDATDLLALAMGKGTYTSIGDWNDSHTHAEVLAAFDQAYDLAIRAY